MAPKKNENKTKKGKETKTSTKKNGPKLKKNIIKVKVPAKNLKKASSKDPLTDPDVTKDAQRMLTFDRMNEVARAQLVKESPVPVEVTEPVVKKKRGRKRKIEAPVARAQLVKESPVPVEVTEPVVKKKRGRKRKIEAPVSEDDKRTLFIKGVAVQKENYLTLKDEVNEEMDVKQAVPVEVVPKKKRKEPAKVQAKGVKTPKVAAPKKAPVKRGRGRPPLRGKLVTDEGSTTTSPSILSQLLGFKTPVKDPEKTLIKSPVSAAKNDADSRRTSVTSASEWSWTKNISESSTTTCITVHSTDIVRIDGKLPKIQLSKIDHMLNQEPLETKCENKELENSLSEDSSSSSSSSCSSSSSGSSTVRTGLNLSTSSITQAPLSPSYSPIEQSFDKSKLDTMNFDELSRRLEMLAHNLQFRVPDIGNENETLDMKPLEEKVYNILEEEYNTVVECNFVCQMISQTSLVPETSAPEIEKPIEEPDFAKPDMSLISNVNPNKTCDNRNDFSYEYPRRRDSCVSYDDDDALSLFAESLTGMDSRLSSVASVTYAPPNEEYVPQPIGKKLQNTADYQPTKISNVVVCEKQKADSTSIHKEPELDTVVNDKVAHVTSLIPAKPIIVEQRDVRRNNPPLTITSYQRPRIKCTTLTGVCFFYLTNTCNRINCFFPHRMIEEAEFKQKLRQLSEKEFFQEYMGIGKWPSLKKKYIKCFVDECQRRELPKILVEMVIEFMSKLHRFTAEEIAICFSIMESTLTYLNAWDLSVCEELLEYNVNGKVLCDLFMEVIGDTQNFSQFKHVFIKLTEFMVNVNRTFNFEVVSHILERVCILPFEGPLSESVLSMIERTDKKIFDTKMMNIFEQQLSHFNKELYKKLLALKEKNPMDECSRTVSEHSHSSSLQSVGRNRELEPLIVNPSATDTQRYTIVQTSPDTTNTDNMNKPPVNDPVIIRTFNNLRSNMSQNQSRPMHHMRPNMSRPNMNHSMRPPNFNRMMRPNMHQPQQGPMYSHNGHPRMQAPRMQMRPQKRPMGHPGPCGPPYKYQRRFGPDYYGNH